jgi:hypothetical protein
LSFRGIAWPGRSNRPGRSVLDMHQQRLGRESYSFPISFFLWIRQSRKRLAFCFKVLGFVRPPICQALAIDADKGLLHTDRVVRSEGDAVVIAKIELRQISPQVLLTDGMIGADQAALEDREIPVDGVGMGIALSYIFVTRWRVSQLEELYGRWRI